MKPWRQFTPEAYGVRSTGYLLVGEAPGHVSLMKGRRFTGPAGMLIRRALQSVGAPRYRDLEDLFYMTDVVKCHPAPAANPASNRSPRKTEVETCSDYLLQEIQVLRPSVIVTFGKTAAEQVAKAMAGLKERRRRSSPAPRAPRPRLIAFPHPSPRNQLTIRKHYASMQAFQDAIADTFRGLIARLVTRDA
jgi:uracil-DNA glycosylase family 4